MFLTVMKRPPLHRQGDMSGDMSHDGGAVAESTESQQSREAEADKVPSCRKKVWTSSAAEVMNWLSAGSECYSVRDDRHLTASRVM